MRRAVFVPVCARVAPTSPSVLAGRWVLSWRRLKDGVPSPPPSLRSTHTHTHTHTLIMFSCNFTSFLAGAAAELTDWEQTGGRAISSDTWERPEDPRSSLAGGGDCWRRCKTPIRPPWKKKRAPLKDQLKSHYRIMRGAVPVRSEATCAGGDTTDPSCVVLPDDHHHNISTSTVYTLLSHTRE